MIRSIETANIARTVRGFRFGRCEFFSLSDVVISDKRCKTQPGACYILFYSAKGIGNYFIHVEGIVGCRC